MLEDAVASKNRDEPAVGRRQRERGQLSGPFLGLLGLLGLLGPWYGGERTQRWSEQSQEKE
jgi:hypothetical protein